MNTWEVDYEDANPVVSTAQILGFAQVWLGGEIVELAEGHDG